MKLLPADFQITRYGVTARLVTEADAEFITQLRSDKSLGRYIHASDGDIEKQIQWIKEYKERESKGLDFYFIFFIDKQPQGVARIYNVHENDFTSGSWIFKHDAKLGIAPIGDIISREIAYSLYPNSINYFDVRKDNISVVRYAMSYKPEIIREDELNIYFKETKEQFNKYKKIYLRMVKQ